MLEDLKLKVGDEVEAFGCKGVVADLNYKVFDYPIVIKCENLPDRLTFTIDGRYELWNDASSLKVIKRKEVKQFKTFTMHVTPVGMIICLHDGKYPNGDLCSLSRLIKTKSTVDIEVEW